MPYFFQFTRTLRLLACCRLVRTAMALQCSTSWLFALLAVSLAVNSVKAQPTASKDVKWYDLDGSMDCARKRGQKIVVLIYTEWDGWSTLMLQRTFHDPKVVALLNDNFCLAKVDALSKEDIWFRGYRFPYRKDLGANQLAYQLLEGRMKYPSLVFLTKNTEVLSPVHGYMEPAVLLKLLKFFHEDKYLETTWEQYQRKK
jgi:thioredoxin-related protein